MPYQEEDNNEHLAYGDFHSAQIDGSNDEHVEGQRGFLGDAWQRLRNTATTTRVAQQQHQDQQHNELPKHDEHEAALAVSKRSTMHCVPTTRH